MPPKLDLNHDAARAAFTGFSQSLRTPVASSREYLATLGIDTDGSPDDPAAFAAWLTEHAPPELVTKASASATAQQEARAKTYGIEPKEGGNRAKPTAFSAVPDDEFADPVNYRYPLHAKAHVDDAASRWADASAHQEYSAEEKKAIAARIAAAQRKFGETATKSWSPEERAAHARIALKGAAQAPPEGCEADPNNPEVWGDFANLRFPLHTVESIAASLAALDEEDEYGPTELLRIQRRVVAKAVNPAHLRAAMGLHAQANPPSASALNPTTNPTPTSPAPAVRKDQYSGEEWEDEWAEASAWSKMGSLCQSFLSACVALDDLADMSGTDGVPGDQFGQLVSQLASGLLAVYEVMRASDADEDAAEGDAEGVDSDSLVMKSARAARERAPLLRPVRTPEGDAPPVLFLHLKAGAKHSAADAARLQVAHDAIVTVGRQRDGAGVVQCDPANLASNAGATGTGDASTAPTTQKEGRVTRPSGEGATPDAQDTDMDRATVERIVADAVAIATASHREELDRVKSQLGVGAAPATSDLEAEKEARRASDERVEELTDQLNDLRGAYEGQQREIVALKQAVPARPDPDATPVQPSYQESTRSAFLPGTPAWHAHNRRS